MTKATRLGVSALMVIGGLALGAFAGCSDDDPAPPPPEEDSGTPDTFRPDTGTPETPGDTGTADMGSETPPFVADRAATLVFASPDLGGKLVCLAAFLDGTDEKTTDPFQTLPSTGAIGIPDSTAPTDTTKTIAFPYGAVVPVPLSDTAVAALENFNVVAFLVDANPAASMKTCKEVWKDVRADEWRWRKFPKQSIKTGEHGIIAFQGCRTAGGTAMPSGACGATGNNFKIELRKASMTKPSESGANVGFQFLHLSQFGGFALPGVGDAGPVTVPGFQSVDIYIKPGPATADSDAGTDGGDAATAPALIKVAEDVSYDGAITALKGFTLPAGVKNADSFLVVAPRVGTGGTSFPCSNSTPQPSGTCPNWTLPLAPFFSMAQGYQRVGGGLEFPNTNQVIMLSGSPIEPLADGGMGAPTLRIPFARAASWM